MNAEEARQLSSQSKQIKNYQGVVKYIDSIYERIETAASEGNRSITIHEQYFFGYGEAIRERLVKDNFSVVYDPNPDPGNPCSIAQTTISW